jgi:beta-1,4-mannosyltransferase
MKIVAWPKFVNLNSNKYNYLLYKDFQFDVYEFKKIHQYWKYDIFHIHWPETYLNNKSIFLQVIGSLYVILTLRLFKIFGAKIIWTVHNLEPHTKNYNPIFSSNFYRLLISNVDGFIFLSEVSLILFEKTFCLKTKNKCVIPHGYYFKTLNNFNPSSFLRSNIDFPNDYFLYFGLLREYKGIEKLIDLFNNLDYNLVVVGKPESIDYLNYLIEKASTSNIAIIPEFLTDEELEWVINQSNGIIIPFNKILNSGSVIHSISLNKPVLVPKLPQFVELKNLLKDHFFINFIENELSIEEFENFKKRCILINKNNLKVNLTPLNWDSIRDDTTRFFKNVINR